jgi:hypothetical protein
VKAVSADENLPQLSGISLHESVCEFTLGQIEHYTVVTLSATQVLSNKLDFDTPRFALSTNSRILIENCRDKHRLKIRQVAGTKPAMGRTTRVGY